MRRAHTRFCDKGLRAQRSLGAGQRGGAAECLADRRGRARGLSLRASRDSSEVGCLCLTLPACLCLKSHNHSLDESSPREFCRGPGARVAIYPHLEGRVDLRRGNASGRTADVRAKAKPFERHLLGRPSPAGLQVAGSGDRDRRSSLRSEVIRREHGAKHRVCDVQLPR